jgi:hypothetical protein
MKLEIKTILLKHDEPGSYEFSSSFNYDKLEADAKKVEVSRYGLQRDHDLVERQMGSVNALRAA